MTVSDRAESLDERDEVLQQAIDFIQQSAKRWHNRLSLDNLRLSERYLEGELQILVLFKVFGVGFEEYCAILNRRLLSLDALEDGRNLVGSVHSSEQAAHVELKACRVGIDHDKHAVLVENVQPVDQPQMLSVPTTIRLERVDRLPELLGGGWHLSLRRGLKFLRGGDVVPAPDGEGHPCDVRRAGVGSIGKVVKAGSDRVDGIAKGERNVAGNRWKLSLDLEDSLPSLSVVLGDNWIGIGPMEGNDRRFEIIDVLFRTVELQPDAIEGRHALPSSHG